MNLFVKNNYEPKSMNHPLPIIWKRAKNELVWDENNKKYIDFTSGIFVQNYGHSNKRVIRAIKRQLNKNLLYSYMYKTDIRKEYTRKLSNVVGYDKVFLLSSGTEATECAVRIMRANGIKNGKTRILSFRGAMHGRTMAADLCKGNNFWNCKDFISIEHTSDKNFNIHKDFFDVIYEVENEIAGIIIETYEGWSCRFHNHRFLSEISKWCKKRGILICLDDIQAGIGRFSYFTNKHLYPFLSPDLICLGKGLGGGLPLSAVCGNENTMDIFKYGEMSSTHSANPVCCAAGLALIKEYYKFSDIDHFEKSSYIQDWFDYLESSFLIIKEINVSGFVAALIFENEKIATDIVRLCYERGLLLVHTGRESIKFGPPLTIRKKYLEKGFSILRGVLDDYFS